jgi:hypothetical protein
MKSTRICPYCGSENVRQFGRCTQEECFFTCDSCQMLSDLITDYANMGRTYLRKKDCEANRRLLRERNQHMKCDKCSIEIGQPGTAGNYEECKRVFTGGKQITIGYLEHEWHYCFDCWKKM